MKITQVDNCPPGLQYFDKDDLESKLQPQDIEDIVEIFQTPLTGSYNWDYTDADNRLKKLYELGKKLSMKGIMQIILFVVPNYANCLQRLNAKRCA